MGKLTYKGLVPPDDHMFTGGVELFKKTDVSAPQSCADENEPSREPFKPHREFSVDWDGDRYTLGVDTGVWKRFSRGKRPLSNPTKRSMICTSTGTSIRILSIA